MRMFSDEELPDSPAEQVRMLQNILISRATGGMADERAYRALRSNLIHNSSLKKRFPEFVRTCGDLDQFWGHIKPLYETYDERRKHIWDGFAPLLAHLEGGNQAPADDYVGEVLSNFDAEGIHRTWIKMLERRHNDPDGAITIAKTLLEDVCKNILEEKNIEYGKNADLPQLYHMTAESLNLAPSQHTELIFKSILGNCQQVVNNLGSIRNKIGDAHGKGKRPVRPSSRHAALAANLAGAMATFLIETLNAHNS